jgi:RNA polymerase sigma-70 factor (ECF subfamily)
MDSLAAALEAAEKAWPELERGGDRFAELLGERAARDPAVLAHAADLRLCLACAAGNGAALRAFEARFLPAVADYVARIDPSPAFADEVRQRLRERLLVGAPPRIAGYSARGPLAGWLRTAALREAIDLRRAASDVASDQATEEDLLVGSDPEVRHIQQKYRGDCEAAFKAAFAALPPRERNLLRMHYLDRVGVDALAQLHRVHRATASRWLAQCRRALLAGTRARLAERLGLPEPELDSLLGLLRSQIALSLRSSSAD